MRQELTTRGLLGEEEHTFTQYAQVSLTEAERSDHRNYHDGMMLRLVRNGAGQRSGSMVNYSPALDGFIQENPDAFQVFEQSTIALRAGDSIRISANHKSKDGHTLNNGATYKVKGFNKGDIELENGWKLDKDDGLFTYGHVLTSYSAQGKTTDHVIVVQGDQSLPATDMAQFYVSVSRGKKTASVWVDSKQDTLEAVEKEDKRLLASDLVRKPRHKIRQKLKRHVQFLRNLPSHVASKARDVVRNFTEPTYAK